MPDPKNPLSDTDNDDFDALLDALGGESSTPAAAPEPAPAPPPAPAPARAPIAARPGVGAPGGVRPGAAPITGRAPISTGPIGKPLAPGGAIGARAPLGAGAPAVAPSPGPITARAPIGVGAQKGPAITAGPIGAKPASAGPITAARPGAIPTGPIGAKPIAPGPITSTKGPAITTRPRAPTPAPAPAPAPRAPVVDRADVEDETTFMLSDESLQPVAPSLDVPPLDAPAIETPPSAGPAPLDFGDEPSISAAEEAPAMSLDDGPRTDPPPAESGSREGPQTDRPPAATGEAELSLASLEADAAPAIEEPSDEALELSGEDDAPSAELGSEEDVVSLSGGDDDGPTFETDDESEETISIEVSDEEEAPAPQADRGAMLAATVTSRRKLVDVSDDLYELDARAEVESRIALLVTEAEYVTAPDRLAEMLSIAGDLADGVLGDRARAKELFERANESAPAHLPTLRALRRISIAENDVVRALEYVDAELSQTLGAQERAELEALSAELGARASNADGESRWESIGGQSDLRGALSLLFVGGSRHDPTAMGDALGALGHQTSGVLAGAVNLARARLAEGSAEADTALAAVQEAVQRDPSDVGSWLAMARIAVGRESAQTFRDAMQGLARAGGESRAGVAAVALERALSAVLSDDVPDGAVSAAGVEAWLVAHALRDAGHDDGPQVAAALEVASDDAQAAPWRALGRGEAGAVADASEVGRFFALQRAASGSDAGAIAAAAGQLLGDEDPTARVALEAALLAVRGAIQPFESSTLAGDQGVFLGSTASALLAATSGADAAEARVPPATEGAFERLAEVERVLSLSGDEGEGSAAARPGFEAIGAELAGTPVGVYAAREAARLDGGSMALANSLAAEAEHANEPQRAAGLRFLSAAISAPEGTADTAALAVDASRALAGDLASAELVALFGLRGAVNAGEVAQVLAASAGDRATVALRSAAIRAALRRGEEDPTGAADALYAVWQNARHDGALGTLALRALPADDIDRRVAIQRDLAERAQGDAVGAAVASWTLLAQTLSDAGRPAEAAQAIARARTHALDDSALLANEESLWLRAGMFAEVAERSFDALKSASSDEGRIAAYEKLAELDGTFRNDVASAVLTYEAILELAPGHMASLRTLERYFLQQGRYEELLSVYDRLIKNISDPHDAVAIAHAAARLAVQQAEGDVAAGAPYLAAAFARGDSDLRMALALEAEARRTADLSSLTNAALRAESLVEDSREKATFLARAGECQLLLEQHATAVETLRKAFEHDAKNPAVATWLALALEREGRFAEAAEMHEALAGLAKVPAHQARAYLAAGALWQDRVGDRDRARAALEQVLDREPGNPEAFRRATRVLREADDKPAELARTMARLEVSGDPMEVLPLYLRAAELSEGLGDEPTARANLQTALDLDPERVPALRALARMARDAGDWSVAADVLARLAGLTADESERIEATYALGEAFDLHLSSERDAESAYKRVLELKSDEPRALMRLADLYVRTAEPDNEAETLLALVKAHKPGPARRALQIRLANVYAEKLDDAKKSEETLEAARRESPTDLDVLRTFARLYMRTEQPDKLAQLLDRAANEVRRKLDHDPADVAQLELLADIFKLRGKVDGARVAASIAQALGLRSEKLAGLAREGTIPGAGSGTITQETLELLSPPALTAAHRELFRMGAEVLEKLMPFEPGAARAEKLGARPHPLRDDAERWARTLGLDGVEIWVGPAHPMVVLPVARHPAAIMVPANLENTPAARFALIRALAVVALSVSLLVRSKSENLSLLMVALLRQFDPMFTVENVDMAKVDDLSRRITRALPKPRHSEMSAFGFELAGQKGQGIEGEALQQAVLELANRLAFLATGDMAGALTALTPANTDARAALAASMPAGRLVRMALTDRFLEARVESGADRRNPSAV